MVAGNVRVKQMKGVGAIMKVMAFVGGSILILKQVSVALHGCLLHFSRLRGPKRILMITLLTLGQIPIKTYRKGDLRRSVVLTVSLV